MMAAFPPDFVWGASTSAHQIEGGNVGSDWWALEHAGLPFFAEPSGDACDSYHRYTEDVDLLAASGLRSYRFSIEWARIEPAPGEFSRAALDHYQRMVDRCWSHGVEPLVTLHHFTSPAWFRQDGGWRAPTAVERFGRYVETALGTLSDVSRVCTINEPNMISTFASALSGAPGAAMAPDPEVSAQLLAAHRLAVEVARGAGLRAGLTLAMTAYSTDGSPAAEQAVAEMRAPDEDVFIDAATSDDFLGVQAYTVRHATAAAGVLPHGHDPQGEAQRRTLTGWNYYPQSIGDCVRRAAALAPGLPLLVTENGIATADDQERVAYTEQALRSVLSAIEDGAPVEGYWHWSLLDNFEWIHGYGPTFGLIAVDRRTFRRIPKASLGWLGDVAKQNALPS